MNFKSKKWLIPGLIIIILLASGIFVKVAFDANLFGSEFRTMVLGAFQKNPFQKQSKIKASLIDTKLNLNFNLIEEDKSAFKAFIYNWFGTNEEMNNLSFDLSENAANALSESLPAELNLRVVPNSLEFTSRAIPGLQNAFVKSDFEFASGSGKLAVKFSGASQYQIKIEDPVELVDYATSSGVLTASTKLEGLFKSLPKVAKIEVNVSGKNISGFIRLK